MKYASCSSTWMFYFPYVSSSITLLWCLTFTDQLAAKAEPYAGNFNQADLLVTFATNSKNIALIEASRPWRTGVRTHILVDDSVDLHTMQALGKVLQETFTITPDFPGHPGSIRHVLAPLFAYHAVGYRGFKWMLVGDADTVFVIPAVLRMLNELRLSPEEPHIISDFLLECDLVRCIGKQPCPACFGPNLADPRCLPCPAGAPACPCRLPDACTKPGILTPRGANASRCHVRNEVSAYGGAGIIYSAGMLREMVRDPRFYLPMAFKLLLHERPFGDIVLAELARRLGYGYSRLPRPEDSVPPRPGRWFAMHSQCNDARSPREQLADLLAANRSSLAHMVSLHVRSWHVHDFATEVLPVYREVVRVLLEGPGAKPDAAGE